MAKVKNPIDFVLLYKYGEQGKNPEHDYEYLRYFFRSVEKYASWVRYIHFVTVDEVPVWLNIEHEKLKVVHVSDFMPTQFQPTTNLNAVSLYLDLIPGISSEFVLFDGYEFLMKPSKERTFFKKGLPYDAALMEIPVCGSMEDTQAHVMMNNAAVLNTYFDKGEVLKQLRSKFFARSYGDDANTNRFLQPIGKFTGFAEYPIPYPMTKSMYCSVRSKIPGLVEETCGNSVETKYDINYNVIRSWTMCEGKFIPMNTKSVGCFETGTERTDVIVKAIEQKKFRLIGLRDAADDTEFDAIKTAVLDAMDSAFPAKSEFERVVKVARPIADTEQAATMAPMILEDNEEDSEQMPAESAEAEGAETEMLEGVLAAGIAEATMSEDAEAVEEAEETAIETAEEAEEAITEGAEETEENAGEAEEAEEAEAIDDIEALEAKYLESEESEESEDASEDNDMEESVDEDESEEDLDVENLEGEEEESEENSETEADSDEDESDDEEEEFDEDESEDEEEEFDEDESDDEEEDFDEDESDDEEEEFDEDESDDEEEDFDEDDDLDEEGEFDEDDDLDEEGEFDEDGSDDEEEEFDEEEEVSDDFLSLDGDMESETDAIDMSIVAKALAEAEKPIEQDKLDEDEQKALDELFLGLKVGSGHKTQTAELSLSEVENALNQMADEQKQESLQDSLKLDIVLPGEKELLSEVDDSFMESEIDLNLIKNAGKIFSAAPAKVEPTVQSTAEIKLITDPSQRVTATQKIPPVFIGDEDVTDDDEDFSDITNLVMGGNNAKKRGSLLDRLDGKKRAGRKNGRDRKRD